LNPGEDKRSSPKKQGDLDQDVAFETFAKLEQKRRDEAMLFGHVGRAGVSVS